MRCVTAWKRRKPVRTLKRPRLARSAKQFDVALTAAGVSSSSAVPLERCRLCSSEERSLSAGGNRGTLMRSGNYFRQKQGDSYYARVGDYIRELLSCGDAVRVPAGCENIGS